MMVELIQLTDAYSALEAAAQALDETAQMQEPTHDEGVAMQDIAAEARRLAGRIEVLVSNYAAKRAPK